MSPKVILKKSPKRPDFLFALIVLALTGFGILMIYDASSVSAFQDFGDKYYFLKEQSKWFGISLVVTPFFIFLNYQRLYLLSPLILLLTILLLGAVFLPGLGIKAYGASRWLDLRLFTLQPSEFAKLGLVIYLSAWFSQKEKGRLWAFLLLAGLILSLVILQPDMGTAMILAVMALILYFLSQAPLWHFLALLPALFVFGLFLIKIAPYRFLRLLSFLNPNFDPQGASYHLQQILIALGSGSLLGVGLGQSRQKYAYLPESMTDSIFAIIAEEVGFLGALVLILVFLFLAWRGFKISQSAPDRFGQLLAAGITSWIILQALTNFSAMVALIPLTGIPLPFISYGGSSLVVTFVAIGILLNISWQQVAKRQRKK